MMNRLACRRFPKGEFAEEAALYVMNKLAEDDWRRVRAFTGESTMATYLAAVTLRLLEDFSRSRFGRTQPPAWVKRLGGIWITLFRLLCLERYSPMEAVEILTSQQHCQAEFAEKTAYQLLGEIPSCGGSTAEHTGLSEDIPATQEQGKWSQPEQHLEQTDRQEMLDSLGRIIFAAEDSTLSSALMRKLAQADIQLNAQERLLLTLCFHDGVSVTEAGRLLGWNRYQVHGRLRRLLARLRLNFIDAGLEEDLRLLLSPT